MGSLFSAILNTRNPDSDVDNLAKIGQYLAEDWGGVLDNKRGDLAEIAGAKGVWT